MVLEQEPSDALAVGARVYTEDGGLLGRVTEMRSRAFQVGPPQAPAYWLSTDCIRWTVAGVVLLAVDSAEVGNCQMDWPGGAAADDSPDVGGEH